MGRPRRSVGAGSPPRRRGKGSGFSWQGMHQGITPAQAGKSCSDCRCSNRRWDHPRAGGEKQHGSAPLRANTGSPPRRRGKGTVQRRWLLPSRITPAQAGKRLTRPAMTGTPRDHPRIGGEKSQEGLQGQTTLGSPPRGRGKADLSACPRRACRITPAWAGKSLFCFTAAVPIQDHPRMGGEKQWSAQCQSRQ